METASAIRKLPLNKLVLSPANVRKTPPPAAEGAELKASLKAHGLKQNLIVHAAEDKGIYAVVAGGRRLKALQELAGEGNIPADYKVPCLVEEPDEAIETSLLENTVRSAMLGSVSEMSCWVRTAVIVLGDIRGAYRGRQTDVRVKRSRSEARTTLEAAATPQAI